MQPSLLHAAHRSRIFILWKGNVELAKDDGLVVYDWSPISMLGTWIFVTPGTDGVLREGVKLKRTTWMNHESTCGMT